MTVKKIDISKVAAETQKTFPATSPNFAPPPNAPLPLPDIGDVYEICGINRKTNPAAL